MHFTFKQSQSATETQKTNKENRRRVPLTAILKMLLTRSLACLLTHVQAFIWLGQCTVSVFSQVLAAWLIYICCP